MIIRLRSPLIIQADGRARSAIIHPRKPTPSTFSLTPFLTQHKVGRVPFHCGVTAAVASSAYGYGAQPISYSRSIFGRTCAKGFFTSGKSAFIGARHCRACRSNVAAAARAGRVKCLAHGGSRGSSKYGKIDATRSSNTRVPTSSIGKSMMFCICAIIAT